MQMQGIAGKLEECIILNMLNMEYLLHNSPECDWHSTIHRISKCIQSYFNMHNTETSLTVAA